MGTKLGLQMLVLRLGLPALFGSLLLATGCLYSHTEVQFAAANQPVQRLVLAVAERPLSYQHAFLLARALEKKLSAKQIRIRTCIVDESAHVNSACAVSASKDQAVLVVEAVGGHVHLGEYWRWRGPFDDPQFKRLQADDPISATTAIFYRVELVDASTTKLVFRTIVTTHDTLGFPRLVSNHTAQEIVAGLSEYQALPAVATK